MAYARRPGMGLRWRVGECSNQAYFECVSGLRSTGGPSTRAPTCRQLYTSVVSFVRRQPCSLTLTPRPLSARAISARWRRRRRLSPSDRQFAFGLHFELLPEDTAAARLIVGSILDEEIDKPSSRPRRASYLSRCSRATNASRSSRIAKSSSKRCKRRSRSIPTTPSGRLRWAACLYGAPSFERN